jgi:hypothetical protein
MAANDVSNNVFFEDEPEAVNKIVKEEKQLKVLASFLLLEERCNCSALFS